MESVADKSSAFAVRIIRLADFLRSEQKQYVLADQVLRSGTSIGANVAEAECSISKKDFLAKMYIAYKESGETLFWLRALHDSNKLTDSQFESINNDCVELNKMLASITKTTRENIEQQQRNK